MALTMQTLEHRCHSRRHHHQHQQQRRHSKTGSGPWAHCPRRLASHPPPASTSVCVSGGGCKLRAQVCAGRPAVAVLVLPLLLLLPHLLALVVGAGAERDSAHLHAQTLTQAQTQTQTETETVVQATAQGQVGVLELPDSDGSGRGDPATLSAHPNAAAAAAPLGCSGSNAHTDTQTHTHMHTQNVGGHDGGDPQPHSSHGGGSYDHPVDGSRHTHEQDEDEGEGDEDEEEDLWGSAGAGRLLEEAGGQHGLHGRRRLQAVDEDDDSDGIGGGMLHNQPHGPQTSPQKQRRQLLRSLAPLREFPAFNLSHPVLHRYALLVDSYLSPWVPIAPREQSDADAAAAGGDHEHDATAAAAAAAEEPTQRGYIAPSMMDFMADRPMFMACCAHVRVVRGRVFYRYGGFHRDWFKLRRLVYTLATLRRAIALYGLRSLSAEFFLNTCDLPISYDNSLGAFSGGFAVLSTQMQADMVDIAYPDPVDLHPIHMAAPQRPVAWERRKSMAVFRGGATNFDLFPDSYNWRASPRIRLHKMTDVRPDLLDARVTGWTRVKHTATLDGLAADGLRVGEALDTDAIGAYKYQLVVDGSVGTSRTCGVLASDQAMIRQESVFSQFYEPLLEAYAHYLPTEHVFSDLFEQLQWARAHDRHMRAMVGAANDVARAACTWDGRALYWAVLLVKYSKQAMEAPEEVRAPDPSLMCSHTIDQRHINLQTGDTTSLPLHRWWPPKCSKEDLLAKVPQPPCTFFCYEGLLSVRPYVWVAADDALEGVELDVEWGTGETALSARSDGREDVA